MFSYDSSDDEGNGSGNLEFLPYRGETYLRHHVCDLIFRQENISEQIQYITNLLLHRSKNLVESTLTETLLTKRFYAQKFRIPVIKENHLEFYPEEFKRLNINLDNVKHIEVSFIQKHDDASNDNTIYIINDFGRHEILTSFLMQDNTYVFLLTDRNASSIIIEYITRIPCLYNDMTFLKNHENYKKIEKWDLRLAYSENVSNEYRKIRAYIASQSLTLLQRQLNLNNIKFNSNQKIVIIDVGTGHGDSLDQTITTLKEKYPSLEFFGLGIEPCKENYEIAQEKHGKKYKFEKKNCEELANVFKEYFLKNEFENAIFIGTCSGFLTRETTKNTLKALFFLQLMYRYFDFLIILGLTPILFNEKIAKRIGWMGEFYNYNIIPKFQVTNNANLEKQSNGLGKTPKIKHNHLNLAMHANPIQILKHYRELGNSGDITSIDISLAFFTEDEIKQISLNLPANLNNIIISGTEKWASQFKEALKNHSSIRLIETPFEYLQNSSDPELKAFPPKFFKAIDSLSKSFGASNRGHMIQTTSITGKRKFT